MKYISLEKFQELYDLAAHAKGKIGGFIAYLLRATQKQP